jgi:hypothetical protein
MALSSLKTSHVASEESKTKDDGRVERRGRPRKYPPKELGIPKPLEYNEDGTLKERRGRKKKSLLLQEACVRDGLPPPSQADMDALYAKKSHVPKIKKDGTPAKKRGRKRKGEELEKM